MSLTSLIVFLNPSYVCDARLNYALRLASEHRAHLIGVYADPDSRRSSDAFGYVRGEEAVREMVTRHRATKKIRVDEVLKCFEAKARREDVLHEFRVIEGYDADRQARLNSLHADLAIIGYPAPGGLPHSTSLMNMVTATSAPFLIVPEQADYTRVAERILIAWNASREARRAITEALPLLKAAEHVTIAVIDPEKNAMHGEKPGADIALHLSRHGINISVKRCWPAHRSVAQSIQDVAAIESCTLLVLGAHSHSRTHDLLFGGVTRSLLSNVAIPTFVAR